MKKTLIFSAVVVGGLLLAVSPASAQAPEGECGTGFCGTPKNNGGGGGGGGGAILVNNTDIGISYSTSDDFDGDGFEDDYDTCPFRPNRDQADSDADGVGDACDNCTTAPNADQLDTDADQSGDVCDADIDNDAAANTADNCPAVPNKLQKDTDGDLQGDACDPDIDNDGLLNHGDPCPFLAGVSSGCEEDVDLDGTLDAVDNCPLATNPSQKDSDGDGTGDYCDSDADNDGVANTIDNCPLVANPPAPGKPQADADFDGLGDPCDVDGFCLVPELNPDPANCLDPNSVFKVIAAAPRVSAKTGDKIWTYVYANRQGVNVNYSWFVDVSPSGDKETVNNPVGTATCNAASYRCDALNEEKAPYFIPRHPGQYTLRLAADLPADTIAPAVLHSEATVIVTVTGDDIDSDGGCQIGHGASGFGVVLVGLVLGLSALLRRRR